MRGDGAWRNGIRNARKGAVGAANLSARLHAMGYYRGCLMNPPFGRTKSAQKREAKHLPYGGTIVKSSSSAEVVVKIKSYLSFS